VGAHHRPTMRAVVGDWAMDAACRGAPVELFFSGAEADVAEAKGLCARCPVTDHCVQFAINHDEWHGVWGGTDESERRGMIRSRRRSEVA
jgi:WhiB family transcriptional regulator, redox-sensing transcriptional regulator